jgi:hypothetical protein
MELYRQARIDAVQHSDGVAVLWPFLGVSSLDSGRSLTGAASFRSGRTIQDAPGVCRQTGGQLVVFLTEKRPSFQAGVMEAALRVLELNR